MSKLETHVCEDTGSGLIILNPSDGTGSYIDVNDGEYRIYISFCPWCGDKLPAQED